MKSHSRILQTLMAILLLSMPLTTASAQVTEAPAVAPPAEEGGDVEVIEFDVSDSRSIATAMLDRRGNILV